MISELLEEAMKKRQEGFHRESPNHVYVTDLVVCQEKKHTTNTQESEYVMTRGTFIHEGLQKVILDYVTSRHVEKERKVTKVLDEYTLEGRIDLLVDDVVVEIKTSNYIPSAPRREHLAQVLIYMHLLNKQQGAIAYIGMKEIREFLVYPDHYVDQKTGTTVLIDIKIDDKILKDMITRWKQQQLIHPFDECDDCFLKKTCKYYAKKDEQGR